jgi:hypothetical protein
MGVFGFGKSLEEKEQEAMAHYKAAQEGQLSSSSDLSSAQGMSSSRGMKSSLEMSADMSSMDDRSIDMSSVDMSSMEMSSSLGGSPSRGGLDGRRSQEGMRSGSIPVSDSRDGDQRSESYTVQRGDTLSGIAHWFYGDSSEWLKIYAANRETIRDPDNLLPGQVLRVPRRDRTDLA